MRSDLVVSSYHPSPTIVSHRLAPVAYAGVEPANAVIRGTP